MTHTSGLVGTGSPFEDGIDTESSKCSVGAVSYWVKECGCGIS